MCVVCVHCVCLCVCVVCLCVYAQLLSCVWLFATPQTVASQVPLSMVLSRQECWNGLPCSPPQDLPDPWMEPMSPASLNWQVDSLPLVPPGKPHIYTHTCIYAVYMVSSGTRRPIPHHREEPGTVGSFTNAREIHGATSWSN